MYKCNSSRLQESLEQFSQFGATANGGVTRLSLVERGCISERLFLRVL